MELSPTAHVILGFLSWRPMSGYDVKAAADNSTRFFWAASYGQIYPELRRLAELGLIEGSEEPQGGRKRTVYSLTPAGEERLREWLAEGIETFEMRDEGLLKLFFSGASPDAAPATLDAKRAKHQRKLDDLRAIEATGKPHGYALMVLHYGIEMQEWAIAWCDRATAELTEGATATAKETA
jgi:PadR family transcriptional regulator, regulatory protein AphA